MDNLVDTSGSLQSLNQIQVADRVAVGDKAYYLGLMQQRGFPVVPGVVVKASVFQQFLEGMDWLEPLFSDFPNSSLHCDVDNPHQLRAIAHRIRASIDQHKTLEDAAWLPLLLGQSQVWGAPALILRPSVAIRAGFTPAQGQAMRGLLASQVCRVEPGAIAQGLRSVWAELFRARSLFYWQRSHLQLQQIYLSVLVQPLWPAAAAGMAYSDGSQVQVQAVWGLGHGLVGGEVPADLYVTQEDGAIAQALSPPKPVAYAVHPDTATTTSPSAISPSATPPIALCPVPPAQQQQPVLTPEQQTTLVDLATRLSRELGEPLDVEWTLPLAGQHPQPTPYLTQLNLRTDLPAVSVQSGLPENTWPLAAASEAVAEGTVLRGLAASPGRILGTLFWGGTTLPSLDQVRGKILVVSQLQPEWLPVLRVAVGLVTEQGSRTSHGAIVARELRVPAVIGLGSAIHTLQSGSLVYLDGDRGLVSPMAMEGAIAPPQPSSPPAPLPIAPPSAPAVLATQILLTLSQPDHLETLAQMDSDGLGLLRSEQLLMGLFPRSADPSADPDLLTQVFSGEPSALAAFSQTLAAAVLPLAAAFAPRPVFYRTLDLRSSDYETHQSAAAPIAPANPLLGWHGTLSYRQNPALFMAELAALRQVQQGGYPNLRLLLPFVRTVEEFQFCDRLIRQSGLRDIPEFETWIMAEVPAVLFQLPEFVKAGVQGIAIGSNDLTQLILAIDRDHPQLAETYTSQHPAMQAALRYLIQSARRLGLPCMMCGEATTQHPDLIPDWVRWGITALSVAPDGLEPTRWAIARAERQLLLDAARQAVQGLPVSHPGLDSSG